MIKTKIYKATYKDFYNIDTILYNLKRVSSIQHDPKMKSILITSEIVGEIVNYFIANSKAKEMLIEYNNKKSLINRLS